MELCLRFPYVAFRTTGDEGAESPNVPFLGEPKLFNLTTLGVVETRKR